jgi:hypothetical protein
MSRSAIAFCVSLMLFVTIQGASCGERIDLSTKSATNELTRVSIQLEAGGNNLVRSDTEDTKVSATAEQKVPISVSGNLSYEERRLASAAVDQGAPLAVRFYEKAEAVLKVDESGRTPRLADSHRLIVLQQADRRPVLFCPDGPLSREELDLIDVVGDSFAMERLLPGAPVGDGDTWANDASVMGPFLTLDTVADCEVQSVLESFNENYAKVRLAGVVHGTEDGAAAQQEIRAVYLFDRRLHRITRLNLAVQSKRSIGGATPGLDAVAKLQITMEPATTSTHITDEVMAKIATAARTPTRDLAFEAAALGFRLQHDRQWFVTSQQREAVTFRRVDGGDLIAQCTFTALPVKSAGRQTSLEQFQKDVTFSLGKSFGELVTSRQWQNAAGLYCYEIIVRGLVEELPVEWHYYLVAPESGYRVSAAVTLEKPMVDRLAGADRHLIDSLQLFPPLPPAQTASQSTNQAVK